MIIQRAVTEKWLTAGSSPVDWCEENYTVSSNIAEFTNTFSNILFIVGPLFCFHTKIWKSYSKNVSTGAHIVLILILLIGVSSSYFHATLSLLGQWLDEIYIIWVITFGYSAFTPNEYRPNFYYGIKCYIISALIVLALTLLWFVNPYINAFWMMLMSLPVLAMIIKEMIINKEPMMLPLIRLTIFIFGFSISIWIADRTLCTVWLGLGIPGLHNIWHLTSAIGGYLTLTLFAYWKAITDYPFVRPTIRYGPGGDWGIPYVHCKGILHS